jgi:hypothetical protein
MPATVIIQLRITQRRMGIGMGTMTDARPMLALAAFFSPSFPTGGFAYSGGLETAVAQSGVATTEALEQWLGIGMDFLAVDQLERRNQRLATEENIGGDVEVVEDVELLVDETNAERHRVIHVVDGDWLSIHKKLAFFGAIDAAEDFHECGLARSVLATQGENLARGDAEADLVERHHTGEALRDAAHFEKGNIHDFR